MRWQLIWTIFGLASGAFAATQVFSNDTPQGFEFSWQLGEVKSSLIQQQGHWYRKLEIEGASYEGNPGSPRLPQFSRLIAIPTGRVAKVEVLEEVYEEVLLDHAVSFHENPKEHCFEAKEPAHFDPRAYAHAKEAFWNLGEVTFVGPVPSQLLTLRPVQIRNGIWNQLQVLKRIRLQFRFVPSEERGEAPVRSEGLGPVYAGVLRSVFANPEAVQLSEIRAEPYDFLLVDEAFKDSAPLFRYLSLKYKQGRIYRIRYVDRPSLDVVHDIIKAEFKTAAPDHVLFIGSIDRIPSFRDGTNSFWTDFPYTLLDPGSFPDFSLGRLPVRTVEDLKHVVEKLESQDAELASLPRFLVTSGYEIDWCHENLKFMKESIFDHSKTKLEWEKRYASDGQKTEEVLAAYNNNPDVVIYDGHGTQKGMTEIPFLISHLPLLRNRTFPIVFDMACLNSFWPAAGDSEDNFAQSILLIPNAGASGVISASHNAYSHNLFRHVFRAAIFDDQAKAYHGIEELGAMLFYGKLKNLETSGLGIKAKKDAEMFFLHGDPAMRLFR